MKWFKCETKLESGAKREDFNERVVSVALKQKRVIWFESYSTDVSWLCFV